MGYLVLFFIGVFVIIWYAPNQAMQLILGLAWMAMILGIFYSLGKGLFALAGG